MALLGLLGGKSDRKTQNTSLRRGTGLVTHQRWVRSSDLKLGMYVSELDVPWEKTTFMFQGFYINSPAMLEAVRSQCNEALVMTTKIGNHTVAGNSRYGYQNVRGITELNGS